ncbi:replication initiation protein [Butyrivibrio sp. NC3005]|uniref:replication initiation protein n=1 Tax=Butyrivibrio sp. NC3005 TaxID=1280685 RepID=UPI00041A0C4F|nr:replication initiation protein [Butyrivibrio sp. NC3005]
MVLHKLFDAHIIVNAKYDKIGMKCGVNKRKLEQEKNTESANMLKNVTYKKSNTLITAKGKSTLLGQKLFAIGILMAKELDDGSLEAVIPGTFLRKALGRSNGSFYDQIVALVEPQKNKASLLDWRIIYKDRDEQKIEASNVITDVTFHDGRLTLRYNSKIKKYITGLKSNYTVLNLTESLTFTSIYTYRLYEVLKSEMDYQRAVNHSEGPYEVTYGLTDLKLMLGIIDPQENADIAKALKKESPDYDKIEKKAEESGLNKMSNYTDFRRYALERGRKELNKKSSIHVEYEPVRMGRGGKVVSVRFTLTRVGRDKPKEPVAEPKKDIFELVDEVQQLFTEKITASEAKAILEAAEMDMKSVRYAYNLSRKSGHIENIVGWMISAIKNGYTDSAEGSINDAGFEQNSYDFEDLERELNAN